MNSKLDMWKILFWDEKRKVQTYLKVYVFTEEQWKYFIIRQFLWQPYGHEITGAVCKIQVQFH